MACASLDSPPDMDMEHPTPGLLKLPLTINRGDLTGKQEAQARRKLHRRLPLLDRELADRPIRHGNRNYVGMLYYRLGDKPKAIESWKETAAEDPTNLNAIQDLGIVYDKIGCHLEAGKWKEKLDDIQSELSGNPDDEKLVYARCRFEQAFAACWDVHTTTWSNGVDQMTAIVNSFVSALEYAGSLISQDEKEDWCLAIGQAYERLSHRHKRTNNMPKYREYIDEAAKYLHFSLSSSQHTFHKAEAWCVLGNALTYDSQTESVSIPDFIRANYKPYWDKPSLCYDKALSLDPGNAWILGNYGHLLVRQKEYDKAIEKLDESIHNDPSSSSWFSYDNRAKANKMMAKQAHNKKLKEKYLHKADKDSEKAQNFNPNPRTKSYRGEIAQNMAACADNNQEKKRQSLQALGHFAESLEIQDGMDISDAHLKQGKCLLEYGDKWSAVQSFKMAYSTGQHISFQESVASKYLLPNHLDHYKAEQKPKNLCAELAFWITDASMHHPSTTSIFDILGKLARREFQSEILDVMEYIVDNQPALQGVGSVITDGFITLRRTTIRRANYERLRDLEERHKMKICSQTSPGPTFPLPDHQPPEKAKNPNCQYDFYVITSAESTLWVQYSLLPAMECNFCSLKGFYEERDKAVGPLKLKSQAEAISKSAYIIIVHSEYLLAEKRCQHLFEIACQDKQASQMALLRTDNTAIPQHMAHIATQFDFSGSTQVPSRWFDLAKFLLGKHGSCKGYKMH